MQEQPYYADVNVRGTVSFHNCDPDEDKAIAEASDAVSDMDFGFLQDIEWKVSDIAEEDDALMLSFLVRGRVGFVVGGYSDREAMETAGDKMADMKFGQLENIEWSINNLEIDY